MTGAELRAGVVVAGLALLSGGCLSPVKGRLETAEEAAAAAAGRAFLSEAVVDNWWPASAAAARRLIGRYGPPDEVRFDSLAWRGRGQWRSVVVRDVTPPYGEPGEVPVIAQTVEFPMTAAQVEYVAAYDGALRFDAGAGELTAVSGREEYNHLRLNLADDVARGRKTPEQARDFAARARALENAGKTPPYLLGLRFGLGGR